MRFDDLQPGDIIIWCEDLVYVDLVLKTWRADRYADTIMLDLVELHTGNRVLVPQVLWGTLSPAAKVLRGGEDVNR